MKDMRDKWMQCNTAWSSVANCYSWDFPEYMEDDIKDFKLITPIQCNKLTNILETLRDTKK